MHFDRSLINIGENDKFTYNEINCIITICPNGRIPGKDGVVYEDYKRVWQHHYSCVLGVQNTILLNLKWPNDWKHSLINRIPKKNFNINDLSTMRDISQIPTGYKIMSKAVCNRIKPLVEHTIAFWQRAFLQKRDRQELIFTLKTVIDDFRHMSVKFYLLFVDFADAFGSVRHDFIFSTLATFNIPNMYCCLVEDLYRYSSFSVLCGFNLSKLFYIVQGTKTGDPLSALLFILVIDRVCKPMLTCLIIDLNLQNEKRLPPIPVQAYADDIAVTAYSLETLNKMLKVSEPIMKEAGLVVKVEKSACFYGRRSGNNWYKGKGDVVPKITIHKKEIPAYGKSEPYKYLGKSMSITGEDNVQIQEFVQEYKILISKIMACKLPLVLKCSAINEMALSKILHHFFNTRLSEKQLDDLDSHLTACVRELFQFYKSTTQLIIYLPREVRGIGIKKLSDVYYVTRLSFLVNILNHDVEEIRNVARQSLKLDMSKRGVPLSQQRNNFLGYKLNSNNFLESHTTYGCQSDWPEMVRYTRKLKVSVIYSNDVACIKFGEEFHSKNIRKILNKKLLNDNIRKAKDLAIQGKFLAMTGIQIKASHSIIYNWNVSDKLVRFCLKARLNILPTEYTKFIWDKNNDPICRLCRAKPEYISHVVNGCSEFIFLNFFKLLTRLNRNITPVEYT